MMNLENIVVSEKSMIQMPILHMIAFIWNAQNKQIHTLVIASGLSEGWIGVNCHYVYNFLLDDENLLDLINGDYCRTHT